MQSIWKGVNSVTVWQSFVLQRYIGLTHQVSESTIVVTGGYFYPQSQVTEYSGIGGDEVTNQHKMNLDNDSTWSLFFRFLSKTFPPLSQAGCSKPKANWRDSTAVTTKHWWHCIDAFVPPSHITIPCNTPELRLYHACGSYTAGELQLQFFEIFDNYF